MAQLLSTALYAVASLQVPGFAELNAPQSGEVISGLVTLRGTADHPAFDHFEVSFAYAGDTTDTWFPIGDPVSTRVIDGRLALWDTSGITDGDYNLRLQVWLEDGRALQAVASGLKVRNYTAGPTPPPSEGAAPAASEIAPTPSQVAEPPEAPQEAQAPAPNPFWAGAIAGAGVLLGVGLYALVGPAARQHLARLRIRQLHQRLDRARSRGNRR